MKKTIILISIIFTFLFAKEDYSEMSTQELIAIIGYVKAGDKKEFVKELKSRIARMTSGEKNQYDKNIGKLNK